MPTAKLTARTVTAAKRAPRLFIIYDEDLPGFGLRVMPSGFKSWVVEYRPKGAGRTAAKRRIALGSASVITAVQARRLAKDTLAAVRQGQDPLALREAERASATVRELAERFLAEHVAKRRKPSTAALYASALRLHVIPQIGDQKAVDISRSDLLRLHSDLSSRKTQKIAKGKRTTGGPVVANRVLAVVGSMYAWAGKQGRVPEGCNPALRIEKNVEEGRERFLSTEELERLGKALHQAETVGVP